jgi:hypothetical protein
MFFHVQAYREDGIGMTVIKGHDVLLSKMRQSGNERRQGLFSVPPALPFPAPLKA